MLPFVIAGSNRIQEERVSSCGCGSPSSSFPFLVELRGGMVLLRAMACESRME